MTKNEMVIELMKVVDLLMNTRMNATIREELVERIHRIALAV